MKRYYLTDILGTGEADVDEFRPVPAEYRTDFAWSMPGHVMHNPSADQLGRSFDGVQIVNGGTALNHRNGPRAHANPCPIVPHRLNRNAGLLISAQARS